MKKFAPAVLAALVIGGFVLADPETIVNQGTPGKRGPWPVTVVGSVIVVNVDGGFVGVVGNISIVGPDGGTSISVTPGFCTSNTHSSTTTGLAAVNTPAAQATNRRTLTLCNSLQNTGSPYVKCRIDGVAPVMAVTNPGDLLGLGDCIVYAISSSVVPQCIADAANTYVTGYECRSP